MAQSSGLGGIVKVAVVGGVAYFGYNYLVNSGLWASWFGGAAPVPASVPVSTVTTPASTVSTVGTVTTPASTTTPVTPPAVQSTGSTLGQALNALAGNQSFDIDQWAYYYGQLRGLTLSGSQVESLIQAAGLTDATRSTVISPATFLAALGSVGLSGFRGMGAVPMLARASWGGRSPARVLPPNYVRRGAPMIRRR